MKQQSAFKLLKSLAAAWKKPEDFTETCKAWDDHAEEALQTPGFVQIIEPIFRAASKNEFIDDPTGRLVSLSSSASIVGSFIVDPAGKIEHADPDVQSLVGLAVGDAIADFQIEKPPAAEGSFAQPAPDCLIEVLGRSGARFLAHCHDIGDVSGRRSYSLLVADISPLVEGYLRWTLKLTFAEIEILRLLLRRRSIPEISTERDIRVNTVRTHINSINNKFKCRSITEVIASICELSYVLPNHNNNWLETAHTLSRRQGSLVTVNPDGASIEYLRFGEESARPLVILHSLEYGASPPDAFIKEAVDNDYCVYVIFRPGFGRSTPTSSIQATADYINQAIEQLALKNVMLVALSSAGPIALQMMRGSHSLGNVLIVNFLMAHVDKSQFTNPAWVRGLLNLSAHVRWEFQICGANDTRHASLRGARRVFAGQSMQTTPLILIMFKPIHRKWKMRRRCCWVYLTKICGLIFCHPISTRPMLKLPQHSERNLQSSSVKTSPASQRICQRTSPRNTAFAISLSRNQGATAPIRSQKSFLIFSALYPKRRTHRL